MDRDRDMLDYQGRPCKACYSVDELMKIGKSFVKKAAGPSAGAAAASTSVANTSQKIDEKKTNGEEKPKRHDCPVDKDTLGRSTWNLLHTMAAYFPDKPEKEDQKNAESLLTSLSKTYPCPHCAEDFREDLKEHPPVLKNRDEFSKWMCEMHNRVNEKLGKEKFDCSHVMERWYDGWKDGSCDY